MPESPSSLQGKSILLFVPDDCAMPQALRWNAEKLGLRVWLLPSARHIKMTWWHCCMHVVNKLRGRRKEKYKYQAQDRERFYEKALQAVPARLDYALIIRPDLVSARTIRTIKRRVSHCVGYQWDGIARFPWVAPLITEFDRFFVFDAKDVCAYPHTRLATNCCLSSPKICEQTERGNSINFSSQCYIANAPDREEWREKNAPASAAMPVCYYIGSCASPARTEKIFGLLSFLHSENVPLRAYLSNTRKYTYDFAAVGAVLLQRHQTIPYLQNLQWLNEVDVLLDIQHEVHDGFTFRVFESIGYRKKLITSNPLVRETDFYHPHNIFILPEKGYEGLKEFLTLPYVELSAAVYEKYSFRHWLEHLLSAS